MKNYLYLKKMPPGGVLKLSKLHAIIAALIMVFFSSGAMAQGSCNCPGTLGTQLVNFPFTTCFTGYATDFNVRGCAAPPIGAFVALDCAEGPGAGSYLGSWTGAARSAPNCLVYDGPTAADRVVWRQTISVTPGRVYRFNAFFQSVCDQCNVATTTVFLRVNNQPLAGSTRTHTVVNRPAANTWDNTCGTWRSNGATTAVIEVVVVANANNDGNDGAIDDITFTEVSGTPNAYFNFPAPKCKVPLKFTSINPGSNVTHFWDFGNGQTSTSPSPMQTFGGGVFVVRHMVTNNCDTAVYTDTVKVLNCCDCNGCGNNLVRRGNFGGTCKTQYTSELNPRNCDGPTDPNQFTETTDASLGWPEDWCGLDHTPGGGTRFLVADAPTTGTSKKAWIQKVFVEAGHTYCFTAWVRNICYTEPSMPSLFLQILAGNTKYTVAEANDIPFNPCCDMWNKVCGTWTATVTDSIELSINIKSGAWSGTDAGIDDISFADVTGAANADFNTLPMPICVGDPVNFIRVSPSGTSSWDFGDGNTSTQNSPTHTYAVAGTFIVTHILSSSCGIDTVKDTIIVECCCHPCPHIGNLVVNGNFSAACGSSYTSSFAMDPGCPNTMPLNMSPGERTEDSDAGTVEGNWQGTDHTGGASKLLILDYPNNSTMGTGWETTVGVTPGKKYCFILHVKNLYVLSTPATSPGFTIRVNGVDLFTDLSLDYSTSWTRICLSWTAPAGVNTANLALMTLPTSVGVGADLGVDDITFMETCPLPGPMMAPPGEGTNENGTGESETNDPKHSLSMNDHVQVYPVPVKKGEILNISYTAQADGPITMTVFDETGKQIMDKHESTKKGENLFSLKTSQLAAGVYYIRFYPPSSEEGTQKMIVIE